ncbi:MAG: citramalate synthase, partial [Clostridia bacterium]|nr:citramalate synthase [Clostridia bacterium]
ESFDIEENYALGVCASTADITISVDGEKKTASATGIGPVHALDKAIREAVAAEFPRLAAVHLVDYKVRVMTPESATAATVAVLIDSTDGSRNWSTVAASVDVIQASANALADAYDYYLQLYGKEL